MDSEDKEGDRQSDEGGGMSSTNRYYECVFCKQGFTTAQALGGHMNIHRRERARNRQPSLPAVHTHEQQQQQQQHSISMEGYSSRPAVMSQPHLQRQETPTSYHMYLPPSSSSSTVRHPRPSQSSRSWGFFEEDRCANLSLQIGPKEEEKKQYDQEEDEVDLELRLGHDP